MKDITDSIKFDERGLVPAIIQEEGSGRVLMLAYMNAESLKISLETGFTTFWSRSRQKLWKKGETSGHLQKVKSLFYDCDADTLLIIVEQTGPACHTGKKSCFYRAVDTPGGEGGGALFKDPLKIFSDLAGVIADRESRPQEGSYVNRLLSGGKDLIGEKVLEESGEVVEAYREKDRGEVLYEAADLVFHLMVLLHSSDLDMIDVAGELAGRFGKPPRK